MACSRIYTIEPEPDGLQEIELANLLKPLGFSFQPHDREVFLRLEVLERLREVGLAKALTMAGYLTETVLPDNTPRSLMVEEIRLKLALCKPSQTFLLIDPYLYPRNLSDPTYVQDIIHALDAVLKNCTQIEIITKSNRDIVLEGQVATAIGAANPQLRISSKYTNVFHDRFWIADGKRGIFIGTSLSGIGRRYALFDYLSEEDATQIVQRAAQIP